MLPQVDFDFISHLHNTTHFSVAPIVQPLSLSPSCLSRDTDTAHRSVGELSIVVVPSACRGQYCSGRKLPTFDCHPPHDIIAVLHHVIMTGSQSTSSLSVSCPWTRSFTLCHSILVVVRCHGSPHPAGEGGARPSPRTSPASMVLHMLDASVQLWFCPTR